MSASLWASWMHHERVIASIDELTEGGRQQFEGTWRFALSPAGPSGGWYWSMRSRLNPTAVKYVDELPARSA